MKSLSLVLGCGFVVLASCGPIDREALRTENINYLQQHLEKGRAALPSSPLNLDMCIDLALNNNYSIALADLETRLASLDRQAAFGAFLPQISLSYQFSDMKHAPMQSAGGSWMQVADKQQSTFSVDAMLPIFVPQAFFAYGMHQRGEDMSLLMAERTRQMITVHVTVRYFSLLAAQEQQELAEQALKEGEAIHRQLTALYREGFLSPANQADAETMLLQYQQTIQKRTRAVTLARHKLLDALGLDPLVLITLSNDVSLPEHMTELSIEEAISTAFVNRLDLQIGDMEIELFKEQARFSLSTFLPRLLGFGVFTQTEDSFTRYQENWTWGLQGTMTLFDGMQSIFDYKSANVKAEQARKRLAQQSLAIILEIIQARQQMDDSSEQQALLFSEEQAAELAWKEVSARSREGFLDASDVLQARHRLDSARSGARLALYQRHIAQAVLTDSIGSAPSSSTKDAP